MSDSPLTDTNESSKAFLPLRDIVDPDGIVAVITVRDADGRVSFALEREFTQQGRPRRTKYLKRSHIPGIRRLLNDLEVELEKEEDRERTKRRK